MTCYHPLQAYRDVHCKVVFFKPSLGNLLSSFQVPCGQCVGCRLERSRQWAVRIMHESSLHEENCFITLTYDDKHVPKDGSLRVRDFQLFMKRFRKMFPSRNIRFFHCGEYGEENGRPHYHACIFGFDFCDRVKFKKVNGNWIYKSETLNSLWRMGYSSVANLSFNSAAYVARYCMKKVVGKSAKLHYSDIDIDLFTGELKILFTRKSEYVTMSRRPGIGSQWIGEYMSQTYDRDYIIVNGRKVRPPRYYDNRYELIDHSGFQSVKSLRVRNALQFSDNNTPERLSVREKVKRSRISLLKRKGDFYDSL